MPVRKVTQTESNNGIPRKADELLSSLGHQVDSREFQRITQVRGNRVLIWIGNIQIILFYPSGGDNSSTSKGKGAKKVKCHGR